MGVTGVWQALEASGAVTQLRGEAGQVADIAAALEGKVLAVDLSTWLFEVRSKSMYDSLGLE